MGKKERKVRGEKASPMEKKRKGVPQEKKKGDGKGGAFFATPIKKKKKRTGSSLLSHRGKRTLKEREKV